MSASIYQIPGTFHIIREEGRIVLRAGQGRLSLGNDCVEPVVAWAGTGRIHKADIS